MIEKLPGHGINYPIVPYHSLPGRPVIPTAAFAAQIGNSINKLADDISPLGQARRAAQLAQLKYLTRFYAGGGHKEMTPLDRIRYMESMSRLMYNNERRMALRGNTPTAHAFNAILGKAQNSKASSDADHGVGDSSVRIGSQESDEIPTDYMPEWAKGRTGDQLQTPVVPVGPMAPQPSDVSVSPQEEEILRDDKLNDIAP